jgi:cytochrome b561
MMSKQSEDRFARDQERLRRIREAEERAEPTHKGKISKTASCLLFIILLAVAIVVAYVAFQRRDTLRRMLEQPIRSDTVITDPDNGNGS